MLCLPCTHYVAPPVRIHSSAQFGAVHAPHICVSGERGGVLPRRAQVLWFVPWMLHVQVEWGILCCIATCAAVVHKQCLASTMTNAVAGGLSAVVWPATYAVVCSIWDVYRL